MEEKKKHYLKNTSTQTFLLVEWLECDSRETSTTFSYSPRLWGEVVQPSNI